jgi:hypothetical protein
LVLLRSVTSYGVFVAFFVRRFIIVFESGRELKTYYCSRLIILNSSVATACVANCIISTVRLKSVQLPFQFRQRPYFLE